MHPNKASSTQAAASPVPASRRAGAHRSASKGKKSTSQAGSGSHPADPGERQPPLCPHEGRCGGCQYLSVSYPEQLRRKEELVQRELGTCSYFHGKVMPILGAQDPWHYRNKVTAVFKREKSGTILSGVYEKGSHWVLPVDSCLIEDEEADRIIGTIRSLVISCRIPIYNEDTGRGLFRYVLVRRGRRTGQTMVVLVAASSAVPNKNRLVQELRRRHDGITTVVLNINTRTDNMILGEKNEVLYGNGYIEDVLCGCRFRISPNSFYQVNSEQTDQLYHKAMELAALTGKETVIDAYSGIGTIGILASRRAAEVIAVESNPDAVRDARENARRNGVENIRFIQDDAGRALMRLAGKGKKADVLFMDPPRAGSTEAFLRSAARLAPGRIIYISCNPVTLSRDLTILGRLGYQAVEAWPVDLFPMTRHVETVVRVSIKCAGSEPKSKLASDIGEHRDTAQSLADFVRKKPDTHINVSLDMEELHKGGTVSGG